MSAEKLFDFRLADGQINRGAICDIRDVEKIFNSLPQYIGLAIRGSTTRGYSTTLSDLDLVLLYDSSLTSSVREPQRTIDLANMASEPLSIKSRVIEMQKRDINLVRLSVEVPIIPADIFRIVTGRKITEYRKLYSEYIHHLPQEEKKGKIDKLARELAQDDSSGWEKMTERISVLSSFGYTREDYEENRFKLWQARIQRLLRSSLKANHC